MNYTQFVSEKFSFNIVALSGDEFLVEKAIAHIKKQLGIQNNTSISVFDKENYAINDVLNACEQLSFFNEQRLVIVKEIAFSESDAKKLAAYQKNSNALCTLVLVACENIPNVEKVDCVLGADYEIKNIIQKWAEKENKKLEPNAINLLMEYTQKNLMKIKNEIKKLCAFKLNEQTITEQDVYNLVPKSEEIVVFELTTALALKQGQKSIELLKKLMGSTEQNSKVFVLIVNTFRRMFISTISSAPISEIAKSFGVKEFAITKCKQQAALFSPKKLKEICEQLSEIDYYYKCGLITQENALYYICFYILSQK